MATRKIIEIADEIGVSWPNSRSDKKLSDYLNFKLTDLRKLPALGKKKVRVLVPCTAKAYLDWQTSGEVSEKDFREEIIEKAADLGAEVGEKEPELDQPSIREIIERC